MRHRQSLVEGYFEEMFRTNPDPWSFRSSDYEQEKYDRTLRTLDGRHYDRGFEIGCANGVLTKKFSTICGHLASIDISQTAVSLARECCAEIQNVTIEQMAFPQQGPDGTFDLIILSEVAYYWGDSDLRRASEELKTRWAAGGDMILVHWTGETDYPQSASSAVNMLQSHLLDICQVLDVSRQPLYRIDLWRRR